MLTIVPQRKPGFDGETTSQALKMKTRILGPILACSGFAQTQFTINKYDEPVKMKSVLSTDRVVG